MEAVGHDAGAPRRRHLLQLLGGCGYRVLLLASMIPGLDLLSWVALIVLAYSLFRSYSKNIAARDRENATFERIVEKPRKQLSLMRKKWTNRKTTRYFKCKGCGQVLSVPRGSGHAARGVPEVQDRDETEVVRVRRGYRGFQARAVRHHLRLAEDTARYDDADLPGARPDVAADARAGGADAHAGFDRGPAERPGRHPAHELLARVPQAGESRAHRAPAQPDRTNGRCGCMSPTKAARCWPASTAKVQRRYGRAFSGRAARDVRCDPRRFPGAQRTFRKLVR